MSDEMGEDEALGSGLFLGPAFAALIVGLNIAIEFVGSYFSIGGVVWQFVGWTVIFGLIGLGAAIVNHTPQTESGPPDADDLAQNE